MPFDSTPEKPAQENLLETPESRTIDYIREILDSEGWCQGILSDTRGRHCLMGAFNEAVGAILLADFSKVITALGAEAVDTMSRKSIQLDAVERGAGGAAIVRFNDTATSFGEIREYLDRVKRHLMVAPRSPAAVQSAILEGVKSLS